MFSDHLRLVMLMPFLLRHSLGVSHIKNSKLVSLQIRLTDSTNLRPRTPLPLQIINTVINCWVAVSKASRLSFSFSFEFTEQKYEELEKALKVEHIILLKVINNI
ncbi:8085_t:CDS:1 [Funneliformis caledonium]|uniref:8085_t:CDS:1 n=1 Tax=Funneliformis caledonium TaxID=1117310 RepID=A0A9N9HIY2_9GLOM|nr:8085_t:CDS:1 [Funneliformis caledonium]